MASDYYTATTQPALLPTAKPVFSIRDGQIGINKIPENGALDVSGDVYVSGAKAYNDSYHPSADSASYASSAGDAAALGGLRMLKGTSNGIAATTTAYGSLYYSGNINISFGTTLPWTPIVTTAFNTNGFGFCVVKSVSTTGFTIQISNAVSSSGVNWGLYYIAVY